MALFGLIGSTAKLATQYAGRESASAKKQRKEAEQSARRRHRHNNGDATRADRAGWRWADRQR